VPLHHQPAYRAWADDGEHCPASVAAAASVLSLPMSADLTFGQQDRVVAALGRATTARAAAACGASGGPR
jgi:UDP-2-acetamido-2-deoxy-ribo-hexuluronate aminotransferase